MRPTTVSVTGVGTSALVPFDHYKNPNVAAVSVKVSGTVTYTVEYTFDDIWSNGFNPATASYMPLPDLSGLSANADGNFAFAPRACRLKVTAGTGTATMTVIQAGGGIN